MVGTPGAEAAGQSRLEADMVEAHRATRLPSPPSLGCAAVPALAIRLKKATSRLEAAHERADWVVTLDRGIGPEFYEKTCPKAGTGALPPGLRAGLP